LIRRLRATCKADGHLVWRECADRAGTLVSTPSMPMTGGAVMAELSEKKRDSLKSSQYGLPDERKYPMPDKSHARNAKARASQQEEKGNLTASEKSKIDRKADRILDK
jgi:hypothetical protein